MSVSHTVSTKMQPGVLVTISDEEFQRWAELGLLYDGVPIPDARSTLDGQVAELVDHELSATRAEIRTLMGADAGGLNDGVVTALVQDGASATGVALRAASVAAVEDAETVAPAGAWDFAQAPTVAGVAIGTGSGSAPDATPTTKGVVQLAGDLGGTSATPTVPGLAGKAPLASPTFTGTVSGVTKAMVGLGNVDNTSDSGKPVSTAQQTAIDAAKVRANHTGTQTSATISDLTEAVQDIVGALIVAGTNTTVSYDDAAGTFTINATASGGGTDPEVVRDTIGGALVAGSGVQITVNDAGDTITVASTAVLPTRQITAGTGLTGGGDLSADRTLAVAYGTSAGTAAQGNDPRLSDPRTPTTHTHTASQVSDSTATGRSLLTAADAATARSAIGAGVSQVYGRQVSFLGDSITAGSGATNATTTAFVAQTVKTVGGDRMRNPTNAGVAGENSTQVAARTPAVLAAGAQTLVVMVGTNDAGQDVPLATYQANILSIKALCDAARVPMIAALVPPRSAAQSTATILTRTRQYNNWLRVWAPSVGVPVVDTFSALVDPTTGRLLAAYDSGDGIHPNDAGHLAVADAMATVLRAQILPASWPVQSAAIGGLITNPLMTATTAWGAAAGPSFPAQSLVAAANGDLPAGQWQRFTLNNSAGGSATSGVMSTAIAAGQAVGDKLLFAVRVRANLKTSLDKVYVVNGSLATQTILMESPPSATPGPILSVWTATTTAALQLAVRVLAPANTTTTVDVGAVDVYNLTQLGMDTIPF